MTYDCPNNMPWIAPRQSNIINYWDFHRTKNKYLFIQAQPALKMLHIGKSTSKSWHMQRWKGNHTCFKMKLELSVTWQSYTNICRAFQHVLVTNQYANSLPACWTLISGLLEYFISSYFSDPTFCFHNQCYLKTCVTSYKYVRICLIFQPALFAKLVCLLCGRGYAYTAKLFPSITMLHCDYTVTRQWRCSDCCGLAATR